MRKFIILLSIITIAIAGHIYVEQPQVRWQNQGYFNAIILRFSLENRITKSDFIKVTMPKEFGSCSASTLAQGTTAITVSCTTSGAIHHVSPATDLAANTWYTLTLAQSTGSTENAGLIAAPIKIVTTSSSTPANGDDLQIIYDENHSCGQFAIDAAPGTDLAVQLSHSKTQVQAPQDYVSGTDSLYKKLATSYTVYIDVKPKFDYLDGAFIKITQANSGFVFTGTCASEANTCVGVGQTGYQASCVNTTLDSGSCSVETTTGSVGQSVTLEFKGQILKTNWHRIRATVLNPSLYQATAGSVNAQIYSRQKDTYKLYEVKTGGISDQFSLEKIKITDKGVLYFWGLKGTGIEATWGCPVGLYKSAAATASGITPAKGGLDAIHDAAKLIIWNKIQVWFKVETAFPTIPTTSSYKVTLNAGKSEVIPLGSINTNLVAVSGAIVCSTIGTKPALQIVCDKLQPASAQMYYISFANYMKQEFKDITDLGKVEFSQGSTPFTYNSNGQTPQLIINDEFLGGYGTLFKQGDTAGTIGQGNQVFDWTEVDDTVGNSYKTAVVKLWAADDADARSSLKFFDTAGRALLFLVDPALDQICCAKTGSTAGDLLTTKSANCWATATTKITNSATCAAAAAGKVNDYILMRLIANPNVFDFSVTSYNNQGIKRYVQSGFLQKDVGGKLCSDITDSGCGRYIATANDIKPLANQTTALWYNIWQVELGGKDANDVDVKSFAHLALTCANLKLAADTTEPKKLANYGCVESTAATTDKYPGFSMPIIKLNSNFKGNPLYPSVYELDFILCFRFKKPTTDTTELATQPFVIRGATGTMDEGLIASTGVLQSQIFNGGLNDATKFRISIVNYGKKTGYNKGLILPQLLRVGGTIHANDWAANAGVAVFFDKGFYDGTDSVTSVYDTSSDNACWSAIDSAVTCRIFLTTNLDQQGYFYSPAMHRVVINSQAGSGAEFNNYVVVQATSGIRGINMALVSKDSTGNNYDIVKHFPLFGYYFEKTVALFQFNLAATNGAFVDQTLAGGVTSLETQQTSATIAVEKTCAMAAGTLALSTGTLYLYSGFSTKLAQIDTTITGCSGNMLENTFKITSTRASRVSQGLWGTHFEVSSIGTKYWSKGNVVWGQTRTTDPTNKCVQIQWKQKSATDQRIKYGIVCPVDSSDDTTAIDFTADKKYLKFDQWDLPFYIGTKTAPGLQELGFIWSGDNGQVLVYKINGEATLALGEDANSGTKCTLNEISMPAYSGVGMKLQVKATTTLSIVLSPEENSRKQNQLIVHLTPSSIGTTALLQGKCFTNIDATCSAATWTFTLTKSPVSPATTFTPVTVTGEVSLNFWAKESASAKLTGGKYTAELQYVNQNLGATTAVAATNINKCTVDVKWESADTKFNAAVESVAVVFDKLSKAQSSFSISWAINKPWLEFTKFEVTLDFLNGANTDTAGKNTKCNMMSGSSFDYNFATLKDGTWTTIVAKPKQGLVPQFELTQQSFQLMCKGTLGPVTALTTTNRITVKHLTIGDDTIATAYDVGFKTGTTDPADRTAETLLTFDTDASTSAVKYSIESTDITKTWLDPGMEAVYQFNLKVTKCDPSVPAGVWIIVEFSRAISPKLNAMGQLFCEAGFNTTISSTYCEFDGDRRVKILSNNDMRNTTIQAAGYIFRIYGVEQPDSWLNAYKKIYFGVMSGGSIVFLTQLEDKDIGTAAPTVLDVLAYSVSTNLTRSTGTFNIDVKLGQGQVVANQDFYVLFPGQFEEAFYKGFAPSCTLTRRLADWSGFDSTNFVENCTYVNARRVKLFFKVDSANSNAAWFYRLTLSGVPTPNMVDGGFSYPHIIIPSAAAGTTIGKRTITGSMNTSYYNFGDDSSKIFIKWANPLVYAKIGVYSGVASLLPGKGDKFLEAITLTTTATAQFAFLPTTFAITSGLVSLDFKFAPKSTTKPGLAFIEFTTTTSGYAPILPLKVAVLPDKCTVMTDNNYKFPFGKGAQSLPYVIDFTSCQPESSVKLKIYALNSTAAGINDINKNFDTTNFTIDGSGTSKEYEVKVGGIPQVSFVIASTDATVSDKSGVGKVVFEWSASTNQASYAVSNVIGTVDSIKPDLIGAVLTWSVISASKSEQTTAKMTFATVSYTCDKSSVFYYAVSTDNSTLQALTFTSIKAKSFDVGSTQTWPEGDKYNIYGYEIDRVGGAAKTFKINRLKAGATYFGFGVCVTAAGQAAVNTTSSKFATWNQTDNDGRPVVTGLTYDQPLNDAQIASSCSAFSNALGIPCNRTICPNQNLACPSSSASTPSTPSTPTNTTSNTTSNTTKRQRRRQLQTLNCSTIINCTTCASNTTCAACSSGYYVNTDLKSCVATCPANSEIVSGVCTSISSVTELFYTANPDMFAGADTTATTVSTGLASPDFQTLFVKNANLGTVKFSKYTVYTYSGTPAVGTPTIVASYSGMTDTTVLFKATLNGTDGFVFFGIAEGTPAKPTLDQLKTKTLVNGTLSQGFAVYVKNGGSFNQTLRSLKLGTTYTGYYAGQNVYPDLKTGGATDISSQEFKTTGTSTVVTTFASSISTGFFALLALLFALFILI